MRRPPATRALLVHHDTIAAAHLKSALVQAGFDVRVANDAVTGLRTLAATEPELLIVEIDMPERDGTWLLRRMRDDYMGKRPRVLALASAQVASSRLGSLSTDVVLLDPTTATGLVTTIAALTDHSEPASERDTLGRLLKLSLLEGDLSSALRTLTDRIALAYRAAECIVVATLGDKEHIVAASGSERTSADPFWNSCLVALQAGAPVIDCASSHTVTYFAVPLQRPSGPRVGVLILSDTRARVFGANSLGWLRDIGQRLYTELTWRSVHERIAADRDRLRESSMLDPMLGIWTREGLEQAIPGEVSACRRRGDLITFAVLDIKGLRHINDLLGHVSGDAVIRHVSSTISKSLRPQDIFARYASNTFALALTVRRFDDGLQLVEDVQTAVAAAILDLDGQKLATEVVAGVTPLLGREDTGAAALARAFAALQTAKKKRRSLAVADAVTSDRGVDDAVSYAGLETGTTLGGMYQILHEISRGAMGVVYRAEDLGLGRQVAIKTLRPDLVRDRGLVELFRREATTLAQLRHENLVQVYTFGIYEENAYFVMELVEGEPLDDLIEREWNADRHVALDLVERIVIQIAAALDVLHQAGVIHRDVKPANVLLDRNRDRTVLVDFGIAKPKGRAIEAAGTPGYAAPEVFRGEPETPAADVYGLAATAFILLTSRQPFDEDSVAATLARQGAGPPDAPTSIRPGLPAAVDEVLLRALSPDADTRHAAVSSFAGDLIGALVDADNEIRAGNDSVGTAAPRPGIESTQPTAADFEPTGTPVSLRKPRQRRVSTMVGVPFRDPDTADVGLTRGALFRAAYRALDTDPEQPVTLASPKNATLVRAGWVAKVAIRSNALGVALGPQGSNLSWHPTEAFIGMLEFMADDGRDAHAFARELGEIAATSTFARFFGADPSAVPPEKVLAAADVFWQSYHSWGEVTVAEASAGTVELVVTGGPRSTLLCSSTVGLLEVIATLAGARDVTVAHVTCQADEADACRFEICWDSEA